MLLLIGIPFPLRLRGRETRSRHLSSPKANLQALTLIALGAKESNTSTRSGPRTTQRRTQIYQPNTLSLPSRIPSRRRTRSVAPCPAELCNRRIRRRRESRRGGRRGREDLESGERGRRGFVNVIRRTILCGCYTVDGESQPSEPFFFDSVYSTPTKHLFISGGSDRAQKNVRLGFLRAIKMRSGAIGVRRSGVVPLERFFADPIHGNPRKHQFTNGDGVGPRRRRRRRGERVNGCR
ncbi:hypothetical protein BHM03_00034672 [Ensete ventricosum]|nr:hypothetical protein BHM03_00034672 [Ensete ventricosum]